jgi:ElaB/YqjD/DUF883 family membrane-anchored ribosome-binding protein
MRELIAEIEVLTMLRPRVALAIAAAVGFVLGLVL